MYLGCYTDIIYDDDENANNDDENESTKNSNCSMAEMNIHYGGFLKFYFM